MIAKDYPEFMTLISKLVQDAMNKPEQQKHIAMQHQIELEKNPNLTDAQWKAIKQKMFLDSVQDAINSSPELKEECMYHYKNYSKHKG